jgi:hypothetical protein
MESSKIDKNDAASLSKLSKEELIARVLSLQTLTRNHDYVYVDAVARKGCHIGLPTTRPV